MSDVKVPVWVRGIIGEKSPWRPRILKWVAKHGYYLRDLDGPFGCAHYGCAYPLGKTNGEGAVLKITRDPTEGPMCDWIAKQQREGYLRGGFAKMTEVATLPEAIQFRGKWWPVYCIIREEIHPIIGRSWQDDRKWSVGAGLMNDLMQAAREIAKPRRRGVAMVRKPGISRWIDGPVPKVPAEDAWWEAVWALQSTEGFSEIGSDIEWLRETHGVMLLDTHAGNVGERFIEQSWGDGNEDGTNVGAAVIFDPGHTPTNVEAIIPTLVNPCCNAPRR